MGISSCATFGSFLISAVNSLCIFRFPKLSVQWLLSPLPWCPAPWLWLPSPARLASPAWPASLSPQRLSPPSLRRPSLTAAAPARCSCGSPSTTSKQPSFLKCGVVLSSWHKVDSQTMLECLPSVGALLHIYSCLLKHSHLDLGSCTKLHGAPRALGGVWIRRGASLFPVGLCVLHEDGADIVLCACLAGSLRPSPSSPLSPTTRSLLR